MTDDIVTWLRSILHNDRSVELRCQEAAAEIEQLRDRVKKLEGAIEWHIDMVIGDAWLCRIEGKFEDVDRLLGNAVGKEIQAYEINTSHFESTGP